MPSPRALVVLLVGIALLAGAFVLFTTVFCENEWCDAFDRLTNPPPSNTALNAQPTTNTAGTSIYVAYPVPDQVVKSPLLVTGQARGFWFFEAVFTVRLVDEQGNTLAFGVAQAGSEWMTEDYVPFTASLVFPETSASTGRIVFTQDDPSGIGNPLTYTFPVRFSEESTDTNGT